MLLFAGSCRAEDRFILTELIDASRTAEGMIRFRFAYSCSLARCEDIFLSLTDFKPGVRYDSDPEHTRFEDGKVVYEITEHIAEYVSKGSFPFELQLYFFRQATGWSLRSDGLERLGSQKIEVNAPVLRYLSLRPAERVDFPPAEVTIEKDGDNKIKAVVISGKVSSKYLSGAHFVKTRLASKAATFKPEFFSREETEASSAQSGTFELGVEETTYKVEFGNPVLLRFVEKYGEVASERKRITDESGTRFEDRAVRKEAEFYCSLELYDQAARNSYNLRNTVSIGNISLEMLKTTLFETKHKQLDTDNDGRWETLVISTYVPVTEKGEYVLNGTFSRQGKPAEEPLFLNKKVVLNPEHGKEQWVHLEVDRNKIYGTAYTFQGRMFYYNRGKASCGKEYDGLTCFTIRDGYKLTLDEGP